MRREWWWEPPSSGHCHSQLLSDGQTALVAPLTLTGVDRCGGRRNAGEPWAVTFALVRRRTGRMAAIERGAGHSQRTLLLS